MRIPVDELLAQRLPIGLAALRGDVDQVADLVRTGASPESQDAFKDTPLHMAAWGGQLEVVRVLIKEFNVALDVPNWEGWTALFVAMAQGHNAVADYLVHNGANPNWTTPLGWQPLHVAAWLNDMEAVQWVLRRGPRLDKATRHSATPLQLARPGAARREVCAALAYRATQQQQGQQVFNGGGRSESSYAGS